MVVEVTKFQSSDGNLFDTRDAALRADLIHLLTTDDWINRASAQNFVNGLGSNIDLVEALAESFHALIPLVEMESASRVV